MPCYSPLKGFQLGDGSVIFVERGDVRRSIELPCGQCIGCRLERSRQWAVRCVHESKMHEFNCFITLTYNDEHLPSDYSLNYKHYQDFMKRLRKHVKKPISFYMCGEYGEDFSRPHYHAAIFGHTFADRELVGVSDAGSNVFRCPTLEKLWGKGFAYVGELTFESSAYIARYIMKKITGDLADEHYKFVIPDTGEIIWRTPEFNRMSLKPAIGRRFLDAYPNDIYPHDRVILNGAKSKPPRYYDKVFSRINPLSFEAIQFNRESELNKADNTDERLVSKEICTKARLNRYSRSLK